jgi:hypothetical protein
MNKKNLLKQLNSLLVKSNLYLFHVYYQLVLNNHYLLNNNKLNDLLIKK